MVKDALVLTLEWLKNYKFYIFIIDTETENTNNENPPKKLGLVQRFKQMYKEYWYVLIPVHLFTSAIWYGSFFLTAKRLVQVFLEFFLLIIQF